MPGRWENELNIQNPKSPSSCLLEGIGADEEVGACAGDEADRIVARLHILLCKGQQRVIDQPSSLTCFLHIIPPNIIFFCA